jgi:excisionase family DNA binding protein
VRLGGALANPHIETHETEYLMSPEELSHLLGLGRTYTYQLLSTGAIPSVRIGRLRKIRRTDAEKFIAAREEESGRGQS